MALPRIYFEKLLDSSPDIVVAVDREGSIVFYNDGARQTLGYSSEEVRGKPVTLLYPSRDEARRVMRAMRSDTHATRGSVKNFETIFTAKGGEQIPVSLAHEINNPLEVITNTLELVESFVRRVASDEQMVIEDDRFEALQRELAKIQRIVNRVQEMASAGTYETRQYLPGTLMTDLRADTVDARGATVGDDILRASGTAPQNASATRDGDAARNANAPTAA